MIQRASLIKALWGSLYPIKSYRKNSQSLESLARYVFSIVWSLWNLNTRFAAADGSVKFESDTISTAILAFS